MVRWQAAAKLLLTVLFSVFAPGQTAQPADEQAPDAAQGLKVDEPVAAAVRERRYGTAEQLLKRQIDATGKPAALLRILGGLYFMDGKNAEAASVFEQLKAAGALDDSSRFTLAMADVKLNRMDEAGSELQLVADAHPDRVLYQYWLARLDFAGQRFGTAISRLKKVIAADPAFVRAYDSLGLCYEAINDTANSTRAFETAVKVNVTSRAPSPWPELDYSELLFKLGQYENAKKHAEEAVRLDANLAVAHYRLAAALEMLDRYADAIEELKRAASLDTTYAQPYYALARIYRHQGRDDLAEEAVKNFRRLNHTS